VLLRGIARFWIWFFFRHVDVRHAERVPATGPVLLCINHPNNLIDSLLVGAALRRQVHYLATATLFRRAWLGRALRACGVIPIYRRQDDPEHVDRNQAVFAACRRAFREGRLLAIYPEGTTHAESRVQRLKTGAARLALAYEAEQPGELALIPVGLSFDARKAFRARVRVSFGQPLTLGPYRELYRTHPAQAVEALTAALQWAMEREVVHVDRVETERLVRTVDALYRDTLIQELREERGLAESEIDPFRLVRTMVDAVRYFQVRDPDRVAALWHRILAFQARLDTYRVRDEAVRARLAPARPGVRRLRSWVLVLGAPVVLYGAVVHAVPYLGPRWLARRLARRETDYATTRLLASVVAVPVAWGLETWMVARLAGPVAAGLFLLSLPLSGLVAYHGLRALGRARWSLGFAWLALRRAAAARELLAERRALLAELDRAKRDYLQGTRGSSF
jgi:1-acyl-sn-glycerol-3-phosphate acyltransferase